MASSVQKIEVFKNLLKFCKLLLFVLKFASHIMKKYLFMEEINSFFFPYFYYEIIFCCTGLFECTFNFKFCQSIFIFLNINSNQTSSNKMLWEASTYFGRSCREVSWKLMSRSKLSDLPLYMHFWGFWSHLSDLLWKNYWNFKSRKDLSICNWFISICNWYVTLNLTDSNIINIIQYTYSISHKIKTLQMKHFKIVYRSCCSFFRIGLL